MIKNSRALLIFTVISGIFLLLSYYLQDFLFDKIWIFCLFPIFIFGLLFLSLYVIAFKRKSIKAIIFGGLILLIFVASLIYDSELFKSKVILKARLIDDLSSINLILRENNRFEVNSSTLFTDETLSGNYQIIGNKIIFKDKHYSNDFIPDTVTIIDDKIILHFDSIGKPIIDFAKYFKIDKNIIKNAP
jgi:hypothetical protein